MLEHLVVTIAFALAAIATILLLAVLRRSRRDPAARGDLNGRLADRLAETHTVDRTHLDRPPRVRELAVVDRTADGDPVLVPVVRIDLGTVEPPGSELAFEFAASVLAAIHPVLDDEAVVRHYDVEFTFGPDGLLVSGMCRRISVPVSLADRVVSRADYRPFDLMRDVERLDGDDSSPASAWGECRAVD